MSVFRPKWKRGGVESTGRIYWLDTRVVGTSTVRYGISTTPTGAWIKDAAGVAVPAFADVPVGP